MKQRPEIAALAAFKAANPGPASALTLAAIRDADDARKHKDRHGWESSLAVIVGIIRKSDADLADFLDRHLSKRRNRARVPSYVRRDRKRAVAAVEHLRAELAIPVGEALSIVAADPVFQIEEESLVNVYSEKSKFGIQPPRNPRGLDSED